MGMFLKMFTLL